MCGAVGGGGWSPERGAKTRTSQTGAEGGTTERLLNLVSQLHPGAGWEAPGQGRHDAGEEREARDTADGGD